MSFDDLARRMDHRHHAASMMGDSAPIPSAPPDADAFMREMVAAEKRASKQKDIVLGSILLGVGLLITLGTYDSASQSGGTYVIAYGPMIFGAIRLFRGLAT